MQTMYESATLSRSSRSFANITVNNHFASQIESDIHSNNRQHGKEIVDICAILAEYLRLKSHQSDNKGNLTTATTTITSTKIVSNQTKVRSEE